MDFVASVRRSVQGQCEDIFETISKKKIELTPCAINCTGADLSSDVIREQLQVA
jgi:hypothetical protein